MSIAARRLIKHFSNPGDTVLVPFVGSGSECVAAALEGRGYVGFELNSDYVEIARMRLADAQAQLAQTTTAMPSGERLIAP